MLCVSALEANVFCGFQTRPRKYFLLLQSAIRFSPKGYKNPNPFKIIAWNWTRFPVCLLTIMVKIPHPGYNNEFSLAHFEAQNVCFSTVQTPLIGLKSNYPQLTTLQTSSQSRGLRNSAKTVAAV